MSALLVVGVLLILVPIAFNVLFAELARTFDYPDILRREPGEILTRFHAGGTALHVVVDHYGACKREIVRID
jgi:hypothetical protein